jgi:hypothetical protein
MKISELHKTKLYHLSKQDSLDILTPKIPEKLKIRKNAFEDNTIKRVSFAPSIEGCIIGLQLSENEFVNGKLILYAYEPTNINRDDIITNDVIVKEKLVFDAKVTKEVWIINPVHVKLIGSITVFDIVQQKIEYTPIRVGDKNFLKPNGKLDTYLYKYRWNE